MPIATYVFLDLQSSGLPGEDHGDVQVTELCMLAVKRVHLLNSETAAPRVQYKLRMCFNPQKKVNQTSGAKSGLYLSLLKHETAFNRDVYNTINSFIRCLEKPVCLIGQNAFIFHFQLLKYQFSKMCVTLSDDIVCTDSSYAFHDILEPELENSDTSNIDSMLFKKYAKNDHKTRMFRELLREQFYTSYCIETDKLADYYQSFAKATDYDEKLKFEGAELNCFMILKIAKAQAKTFAKWVEQHHCLFSEVPVMVM